MDDSPINPKDGDLDGIRTESNKCRNRILFILIPSIVIVVITVTIILVVTKSSPSDNTPTWKELPFPEVHENVDCPNFDEKDMPKKFENNLWNTPKRGDSRWKEGFQDMNVLVGYPQLKYSSDLQKCTVTVFTKTAIDLNLTYIFDNVEQDSNQKEFDSSFKKSNS